ncbi:hypothetical protein HN51_045410 [Arachis hypogaea]
MFLLFFMLFFNDYLISGSYMFSISEDVDCWHLEILKQEVMFPEPDSYEPTIEGALPTNNICSIFINGTCRLESMDICSILHEVSVSGCTFTLCLGLVQNTSCSRN